MQTEVEEEGERERRRLKEGCSEKSFAESSAALRRETG